MRPEKKLRRLRNLVRQKLLTLRQRLPCSLRQAFRQLHINQRRLRPSLPSKLRPREFQLSLQPAVVLWSHRNSRLCDLQLRGRRPSSG